jgi:phage gp29-like protein
MLAWPYLFQNYALGDLAQLLEIYGMPARLGKYPKNATQKEKATLLRAVVQMGKDAAGIIPEGMNIEFLEAAQGSADLYLAMMNWCERSKARIILGGTLTSGTGEGTNTNALGNVHERGQSSLIRSDVRQYGGTVRRSILWPMAALNFGITDANRAPRFVLDMGETEDFQTLANTLPIYVDMGAKVPVWWLHEKTGIPQAGENDAVLQPRPQQPMTAMLREQTAAPLAALRQGQRPATPADAIAARLAREGDPKVAAWLERVEAMLAAAKSLEEFREMLLAAQAELDEDELAALIGDGLSVAELAGRSDIEDVSERSDG